jgi:menaquinone-9 beta-reductase
LFKTGYCGINRIEENKACLCYLSTRDSLKEAGTITELEKNVLSQNPYLKDLFENSEMLYDKPEVINEISFASKETISGHALMCGDAAGMITPLSGNGMAIAMHGAKICSEEVISYYKEHNSRNALEKKYDRKWKDAFAQRLRTGRTIQRLFYAPYLMDITIKASSVFAPLSRWMIRQTHGDVF